jgi:hypothetical protein
MPGVAGPRFGAFTTPFGCAVADTKYCPASRRKSELADIVRGRASADGHHAMLSCTNCRRISVTATPMPDR